MGSQIRSVPDWKHTPTHLEIYGLDESALRASIESNGQKETKLRFEFDDSVEDPDTLRGKIYQRFDKWHFDPSLKSVTPVVG